MFKATLTAVLLSSVALVPAATIAVVATTDLAHAKSDKGGGNGNKGGNSSGAKSKASGKTTASRGGGSGNKSKGRNSEDPVGNFLRKLTGQNKKRATTKASPARSAAPKVAKAAPAREKSPMHPSNLGNMNGALNANTNAMLAHIRNGNTNGPVGHLAALAVASVNAEGAQDILDLNADFETLDELLGDLTLQEYFEERNGIGEDPDIEEAIQNLDGLIEGDEGYDEAVVALEEALGDDYETVADYESARDGVGINLEIDAAISDLDGDPEEGIAPAVERPDEAQVAGAEADLEAQSDAEQSILSFWNKNADSSSEITNEEQMLLNKLNERIAAESDAIKDAIGLDEKPIDELDDTATCDLEDGCEDEGEEVVATAD